MATKRARRAPVSRARGSRRPSAASSSADVESELPGGEAGLEVEPGRDRSAAKSGVQELSWSDFERMVGLLAREVLKKPRPQAVVGVAHGGVFVGAAVARALDCEFFPVRITRRSRDVKSGESPRLLGKMPRELKNRRVLIVDDVAASGDTLELAHTLAKQVGARGIRTAVLVRRLDGYAPDHAALASDQLVVFPWDYQPLVEEGRFSLP